MQYDFTLNPGGGQRIEVAGTFFKYTSGTGKIRVTTNKNDYIDLVPGQGVKVEGGFSWLNIVDKTGFANVGTMLAGAMQFEDDNVYGTVTVRDNSADIVQANKAFIGGGNVVGLGASNLQILAVANPANSGRLVKIKALRYTISAGGTLPANGFTFRLGAYTPTGTQKANSKLAGGALSLTLCTNESTTLGGMLALTALYGFQPAVISDKVEFKDPVVLPPGMAFIVHNQQPGDTQGVAWYAEFSEE